MKFAQRLKQLAEGATERPWEPDIRLPYHLQEVHMVMMGADGKILFDTLNSEVAEMEYEPDEDGGRYRDVVGKKNLAFIAYLANNALAIAAAIEAAEKIDYRGEGVQESDIDALRAALSQLAKD